MTTVTAHHATTTLIRLRGKLSEVLKGLDHEHVVAVPAGHRSSILWNAGHALVTQQRLHYMCAGLKPHIDLELIDRYAKGTDGASARIADLATIEKALQATAFQLERDVADGVFVRYEPVHTSLDVDLTTIDEALAFNNVHEGLHLGYAKALARDVAKR